MSPLTHSNVQFTYTILTELIYELYKKLGIFFFLGSFGFDGPNFSFPDLDMEGKIPYIFPFLGNWRKNLLPQESYYSSFSIQARSI